MSDKCILKLFLFAGHGYKSVGNDHFFRFGGSDVSDSFVNSAYQDTVGVRPFVNPFFVSPSGKFFRRFVVRDLFETPVVLLVKTPEKEGYLTHVYAEKGLRTILNDPTFKFVVDYFKTPFEKSGIIFNPKTFYHSGLFNSPVFKFLVPKDFKVGDLTKFLVHNDEIPVVVILDKVDLDKIKVDSLTDVAKLGVYDSTIEPVVEAVTPIVLKTLH